MFALLVIISHSYFLADRDYDREPLMVASGGQISLGSVGVDGFFLISGCLITASWSRSRDALDYMRRRVLRIYPGFILAVAFSSFVAAPLLAPDASAYWRGFDPKMWAIAAIKLAYAYAPGVEVNGSLWSIRLEFACYLGVLILGLARSLKWPALLALALGCTLAQAWSLLIDDPGRMDLPWWAGKFRGEGSRVGACFLAGGVFHLLGHRIPHSGRLAALALAGLVAAALAPSAKLLPILLPYLGGYLTIWIAYADLGRLKGIARRGDLTYGLYLYSYPIQLLILHAFPGRIGPLGLIAASTIVTTIPAALSWHLVESPCMRWRFGSRATAAARPIAG